jgi:protein-S-isoprenylcysteine O-methyltransferase Ste14
MDQSVTAPSLSVFPLRLRNLGASVAVVVLACSVYRFAPYNQRQLGTLFGSTGFSFSGADFLVAGAATYMALLSVYFLSARDPIPSKSLRFFQVAAAFSRAPAKLLREGLSREDRVAVLATLLKSFFGPLMVMSMMVFCMNALANGAAIAASGVSIDGFRQLFDQHGFWFLMQLIFFVDVLIFTVGYLVEFPRLGNQIRSVDPSLLGWTAALLCYPPFNKVSSAILGSPVSDFPQFDNPTAHLALNFLMLVLMAIYASASVALGFKASNLTHRGIIARGPYRLIRHPAYVCKNMAWWIGSVPVVAETFKLSTFDGIQAVASVAGWTLLYVLRAVTEEDHLRGVDGEYAAYAAKVRYRFIPGIV